MRTILRIQYCNCNIEALLSAKHEFVIVVILYHSLDYVHILPPCESADLVASKKEQDNHKKYAEDCSKFGR